jgi:two-component system, OmpR family, KDP operon response regulator KdpE
MASSHVNLGDLTIDTTLHCVFVRGKVVALAPIEFKLLHLLARNAGRVLSHSQLLRAARGASQIANIQYVRVYMKKLRRKIEDDPTRPKWLLTTPRVGYRLVRY